MILNSGFRDVGCEERPVRSDGQESTRHRTAIIVSGMHRSGTSAITRVVSLLGAGLPADLIERRNDNERGFWEGRDVVELDEYVIETAGSWWGGWQRFEAHKLRNRESMVARARQLLRQEFPPADVVVLKDPRISRILPLWDRALEEEGFRAVHIIALRHPAAVAGSVGRRNGMSVSASTLSWLAHMLDAELYTRGQPRVFVSFEHVLGDWARQVARVSLALDLEWPRRPDDVAAAVEEFIEPSLAHEADYSMKGPVAAVEPVYEVLQRWAEDDVRPGDEATLDSWRALLEPVRAPRSAVSELATRRRKAITRMESRDEDPGPLGSPQLWRKMQHKGYNIEAASAWSWFSRERRQSARIAELTRKLESRPGRAARRVARRIRGSRRTAQTGPENDVA